jgi:hypothetical protein
MPTSAAATTAAAAAAAAAAGAGGGPELPRDLRQVPRRAQGGVRVVWLQL